MSGDDNIRIYLRDTPEQIFQKCTRQIPSNLNRVCSTGVGWSERCRILTVHTFFSDSETVKKLETERPRAEAACLDCKKKLAEAITLYVAPFRHKIEHHLLINDL